MVLNVRDSTFYYEQSTFKLIKNLLNFDQQLLLRQSEVSSEGLRSLYISCRHLGHNFCRHFNKVAVKAFKLSCQKMGSSMPQFLAV